MAVVKNYPKAIIRKGDGYFLGLGVDKDYSEALKWYKKAAEQKYAPDLYYAKLKIGTKSFYKSDD